MYSPAILALFVSAALALPQKRFGGLTVKVTGPGSSVSSVDELKFVAAITNTGSEDVKVLKYATILDSLPTRSFTVTKDGTEVPFTGVKVKFQLSAPSVHTFPV
jgi:deuterolysin